MVVPSLIDIMVRVYADNAATTQLDPSVLELMLPYLRDNYANPSQPYSLSYNVKKALNDARRIIAECINAEPEEIIFTSGGSESDNLAIVGSIFNTAGKNQIITSSIEHHAVLHTCDALSKFGIETIHLPVTSTGEVTPEILLNNITERTGLVSIMFVNNEIGTIEPISSLCDISHKHGILFHTDAVQAMGHLPIDVKELGVDLLSASAHKFNGPKGIGFLYVRKGVKLSPLINGGAQEFGLRAGTENVASIVGMAYALKKSLLRLEEHTLKMLYFENQFFDILSKSSIDYIINGSKSHIPGIISISFNNLNGESILHLLDLKGISVSTGSACNGSKDVVSHVIKAIGVPNTYANGTIRISFGFNNSLVDAEIVSNALIDVLKCL